jgi:subtilisin family serine protease
MKTKLFFFAIFLLYGLTAVSQETQPDFPTQKIDKVDKITKKAIPDTYIIFFDEEEFQPFVRKNPARDNDKREAKGNEAKQYEQQMIVQLRKIAQEKLDIPPSMISEYYTTATTGIKVQVRNANAKGLIEKLKKVKEVTAMIQDFEINVLDDNFCPVTLPAQTACWGVNFVGTGNYTGDKWAWVLDTGIDPAHPDLNVNTTSPYAVSFIRGELYADGNGHGTHVAGIIAAKNNSIGTLGVASGATVVPVKVLSEYGIGPWSAILSGLNHVAKYYLPGDVVNMSLGGPAPDWWTDNFAPWDDRKKSENAILNLSNAGVFCVLAAGNSSMHANNITPARVNGTRVYTISAMDSNRNIAGFSNFGNGPVDYAAPGVNILSTYKGGTYAYKNGTSMAAPFVSGILLINNGVIRTNGVLNTDKDGTKDPVAIK